MRGSATPRTRPVHGPIASTIASAVSVSPSTVTLAPPWSCDATRSTTPMRSVAPRARAASTSAVVKRAGWTCAVVSVEPSRSATTAGPSIQPGAEGMRWPPATLPCSRAASM